VAATHLSIADQDGDGSCIIACLAEAVVATFAIAAKHVLLSAACVALERAAVDRRLLFASASTTNDMVQ